MKEVSRLISRRSRDPAFLARYFRGDGIDIGVGDDPLSAHREIFPLMGNVTAWNKKPDEALRMDGESDASYDFVCSNDFLQHIDHPAQALTRWLELVKPDGYVIVTLPDQSLYEKTAAANRFSDGHKSSFTICEPTLRFPESINVIDMVKGLAHVASCERISLLQDARDEKDGGGQADEQADGIIEIVLKRCIAAPIPSLDELLKTIHADDEKQAVAACDRVIAAYPDQFQIYQQVMKVLLRWDRIDALEPLWKKAVAAMPDERQAKLYRAMDVILRGRVLEGFQLREKFTSSQDWQQRTTVQVPSDIPVWKGESLKGKSIVIWSEQGLGDEIFFLRFVRTLKEQCGAERVTVMCQMPLVELYTGADLVDRVVGTDEAMQTLKATGRAVEAHDFWVYPYDILAHLEQLPASRVYLSAPPGDLPIAEADLNVDGLKIALAFKGAANHENAQQRSFASLSQLEPLLQLKGVYFYSLQKNEGEAEVAEYAKRYPNLYNVGAKLKNMADTARMLTRMDLVITVDTALANLAGAMGMTTWVMLPMYVDWQWFYLRQDSPWYPSARLFRAGYGQELKDLVPRVVEALHKLGEDL